MRDYRKIAEALGLKIPNKPPCSDPPVCPHFYNEYVLCEAYGRLQARSRKLKAYKRFYKHIRDCVDKELSPDNHVICKICNKNFGQITGVEENNNQVSNALFLIELAQNDYTIDGNYLPKGKRLLEISRKVSDLVTENNDLRVELSQWQCGYFTPRDEGGERLEKVIKMIEDYGYIDGQHHKQWLLDQIAQILLADGYENWKADSWDKGVAP